MKINNVNISNETFEAIASGKCVEGSLRLQTTSNGQQEVAFRAYQRSPRKRAKDRLLYQLEHGWVKESKQRIKVFESLPKKVGAVRMTKTLEREMKEAETIVLWSEL